MSSHSKTRSTVLCRGAAGEHQGIHTLPFDCVPHRSPYHNSSLPFSTSGSPHLPLSSLHFPAGAAPLDPTRRKRSRSACLPSLGDSLRSTKPRIEDLPARGSSLATQTPSASSPLTTLRLSSRSLSLSCLEDLPDELLSLVLAHAARGCSSPAAFINLLLISKKFRQLGAQPHVLRCLPSCALRVSAADWCPAALRFLLCCSQSGNTSATYSLGMMGFYCLEQPPWGLRMLTQAAAAASPEALFSLSVIHFNGSSGSKEHRDVTAGVLLCMKAAQLGHVDAMRELGHCLQDGYGVARDPVQGRQLLLQANLQETARVLKLVASASPAHTQASNCSSNPGRCCSSGPLQFLGCCSSSTQRSHSRDLHVAAASLGHRNEAEPEALRQSLSMPAALPSFGGDVDMSGVGCKDGRLAAESARQSALGETSDVPLDQTLVSLGEEQRTAHEAEAAGGTAAVSEARHQHRHPYQSECLLQSPEAATADVRSSSAAAMLHDTAPANQHSCCCLPSVVLPLHARADGWVSKFLCDWHALEEANGQDHSDPKDSARGVCMPCSNPSCGRKELRENEFRCCSACTEARYCSRVCQAQDWKAGHKVACSLLAQALAQLNQAAAVEAVRGLLPTTPSQGP